MDKKSTCRNLSIFGAGSGGRPSSSTPKNHFVLFQGPRDGAVARSDVPPARHSTRALRPPYCYVIKQKQTGIAHLFLFGAGSGGRTRTVSLPLDFESSTSANSIIPAIISALCYRARCIISHCFSFCKSFFTLDGRLTYYFFVV